MLVRFASLALLVACGSNAANPSPDATADSVDAPTPTAFSFTPGWAGVTSVTVVGAPVGASGPWTTLATLTATGDAFTGTAALAPGEYDYLFQIVGDADAGGKAATYARNAIDPTSAAYEACPADAPSYSSQVANPCGKLTVPRDTATLYHVTGRALVAGAPAAGFIVLVERAEPDGHHYFANRATTGADGSYDLQVASGSCRIQVQHPDYLAKTDAQLKPKMLGLFRREISAAFEVAADVDVGDAEMSYPSYATFAPITSGTLPTTFTFPAAPTHLDIYGAGNEIGDPWYASPVTATGAVTFDGTFNTAKAKDPQVIAGTAYWWGLELPKPATGDHPAWNRQTMVFPIAWATGP